MAYGTFGAIPNTRTLPLAKTFYLNAGVTITTIANGATNSSIFIGAVTMPFNGDLIYEGSVRVATKATGIQSVAAQISSSSSPAPTWASEGYVWDEGVNTTFSTHLPIVAQWENVASGTIVLIYTQVINGSGGPAVDVVRQFGIAIATML